jgi:spermidine/putrescine transport system ATP-binding protein
MTSLATIEHITMRYPTQTALEDVSLAIAPGSYTVLLGPSGSGKTTLLSILGGFLQPTTGRVLISGQDCTTVAPAKRPTATVFQDYALFPHMTVGDNVGFGLRMKGVAKEQRHSKAAAMLETVGLPDAFSKKPHQLSGGQRQRVALARALVVEPQLLLLDEPLGALDMKLRRQMQDELKALQKRVGTAFVHVTHDQEEAMALADQLVVMNNGRIEDVGTPEKVYAQPATRFTAQFMGESSHFGDVAVRPEHVVIGKGQAATVSDVVFQGSFKRVTAKLASSDVVLARVDAGASIKVGDTVKIGFAPEHAMVFKD